MYRGQQLLSKEIVLHKSTYEQVEDGERVHPIRKGFRMECCDCGLVHRINFYLNKVGKQREISFQIWRDEQATGQVRRHIKERKKHD